jgi:hypothetical protein
MSSDLHQPVDHIAGNLNHPGVGRISLFDDQEILHLLVNIDAVSEISASAMMLYCDDVDERMASWLTRFCPVMDANWARSSLEE